MADSSARLGGTSTGNNGIAGATLIGNASRVILQNREVHDRTPASIDSLPADAVALASSPNLAPGDYESMTLTSSLGDKASFVSGYQRVVIVPVERRSRRRASIGCSTRRSLSARCSTLSHG